jgi:hypothetical protein
MLKQCCGTGTGTAGGILTFCLSGTESGTGMHYGSNSGTGNGNGSGYKTKCNKKVKYQN